MIKVHNFNKVIKNFIIFLLIYLLFIALLFLLITIELLNKDKL